ncbi:MAG TPA: hypothetical protein VMY37_16505 [Thermoguttaceae bacterium]|nr:hypothetical protein [Thermoguttaceae bacterium]
MEWIVSDTTGVSGGEVTGTIHVEQVVDDAGSAYMALVALPPQDGSGEHLGIFSLGAIAYHLFSGQAPAGNALELSEKLRETKGLQISSVVNGAGENLQFLSVVFWRLRRSPSDGRGAHGHSWTARDMTRPGHEQIPRWSSRAPSDPYGGRLTEPARTLPSLPPWRIRDAVAWNTTTCRSELTRTLLLNSYTRASGGSVREVPKTCGCRSPMKRSGS